MLSDEDAGFKALFNCATDQQSLFEIFDQGIGIPENEQKFLFEKFFRANNTGIVQGTGLDLTIVKRYVDLMGGKITFKSSNDKGTTFNVALPYLESYEDNTGY